MITIEQNTDINFTEIRKIAREVWPVTYGSILSKEQFAYMMEMMYSVSALQLQANIKKHQFILAMENGMSLGFASYEFNYEGKPKTKIHKLYILTSAQRKGIGKKLIDYITEESLQKSQKSLILNVNRYNKAQEFYQKTGFVIQKEEDIAIGNGYLMEDFVMEKSI